MTHTYAVLEVPHAVYIAVRTLLERAEYQHTFHADKKEGEVIDMHGIALKSRGGKTGTDISVSTLLSSKDQTGRIDFTLNGELTQMDLDKARLIVCMLNEAIEAAVSDEMFYKFLTTRIGMAHEKALMALLDFREIRQGSRDIVNPN